MYRHGAVHAFAAFGLEKWAGTLLSFPIAQGVRPQVQGPPVQPVPLQIPRAVGAQSAMTPQQQQFWKGVVLMRRRNELKQSRTSAANQPQAFGREPPYA